MSYTESYLRSNNPVFVFGTLLNQRRFGPENFEIDRLNNPDSLQNFQSLVRVRQTLFDARRTKHAIRAAREKSNASPRSSDTATDGTPISAPSAAAATVPE